MNKETGIGLGLLVCALGLVAVSVRIKKSEKKRRDELRNSIQNAFDSKIITRTEYDLIWDLTTSLDLNLARHYLEQATKEEVQ
jgi:hypothetical protein